MSAPNNNDLIQKLIEPASQGDQQAQSQLIELTQGKLFKFCILLGHNRELAEDLCQEVYIKAFRNLEGLKSSAALMAWLYMIAKNTFIDIKRVQKQMGETNGQEPAANSEMDTILQVQQVLSQFNTDDRYLLLLVELEGLSYKEAGEVIGKSEDAVRSKIHRLRTTFVRNLK